jgi:hypothetical protein
MCVCCCSRELTFGQLECSLWHAYLQFFRKLISKHIKAHLVQYDLGTDDFDTSPKQRVPSWTDRILVRGSATCHRYGTVSSLKISDHR